MAYSTPGVYVEEISTFPPSVAEVATAIPAFIGYTEKRTGSEGAQVSRINTMLEYDSLFGGAHPSNYLVSVEYQNNSPVINTIKRGDQDSHEFLLYYALSLYFKNGGGSCYIISIGDYTKSPSKKDFSVGLLAIEKEDEPTLIVAPEATSLPPADYFSFYQEMLAQCNKMGDRFSILDILNEDNASLEFRDGKEDQNGNKIHGGIGSSDLMYGAAYAPYLQTALSYQYNEKNVSISGLHSNKEENDSLAQWSRNFEGIDVLYSGPSAEPLAQIVSGSSSGQIDFEVTSDILKVSNAKDKTVSQVVDAWEEWHQVNGGQGFDIKISETGVETIETTGNRNEPLVKVEGGGEDNSNGRSMDSVKNTDTSLYNQLKTALNSQRVILPPSSAIAGIYARVDRSRGVWKSPANESISSIIGPTRKITHEEQGRLNIDPNSGKSINAIRVFTGKGTLVWGARTLAGNDNEWRYISVRRLFNMIEESCQKATVFAVFEPNDATTWLKVKAMIESFLFSLWERGALAGPTAESAYFVNVGLGKTMTTQDILEGRMNVEIGIAAVRPAEFIVLRFSHKLQEA